LCSVMKILATGRDGKLPSLFEPTLTFQLDTSRCFLGAEMAGFRLEPSIRRLEFPGPGVWGAGYHCLRRRWWESIGGGECSLRDHLPEAQL
jgi:hypothetical protein